jgi:hypothetical protein
VINGSAATSDANLQGDASVTLGDSVSITSGTDPVAQPGGIVLVASSSLHANDLATLTSDGLTQDAGAHSNLNATPNNTVTLGQSDTLTSDGDIGVGTYTTSNAQTNSEVSTYGLSGIGVALATTDVTTTQSVTVDTGTKLTAFGNVNLTPGNEPNGLFNTVLSGLSNAQSYFYGAFDIPPATATTDLVSNASLTINAGVVIQSGQNVTIGAFPGTPTPTADGTAHYYATASALTQAIIGTAGSVYPYNQREVYFGSGVPYALGDDSAGTANALTTLDSGGTLSGNYQIGSGGPNDANGHLALIPIEPLSESLASYSSADLSGSTKSSAIYGKQVSINAQTLDINGDVTAGQPTDWSLNLPASLTTPLFGTLWWDSVIYRLGLHNPIFDIPVSTLSPGDSQITATYNAQTNQITVNNVSASSGGGSISLNGGIISSNTLGHIHVNGGLGQVQMNNQTGIPLVVQQVYAGSDSQTGSVVSKVDITDTNQPAATRQTLYVYQPGQPIAVYQGAAGATLGTGTPSSTVTDTSATYNPEAGLCWQWVQQATLGRTITYDSKVGNSSWAVSDWVWTSGTATNPWEYVDPSTGQEIGQTAPVGQQIIDTSLENTAFTESITGSSSIGFSWDVQYHHDSNGNTHYGFANADGPLDPSYDPNDSVYHSVNGGSDWYYYYPNSAALTLTSSVKADNPITVDFNGLSAGNVSITSNAPVILAGKITNPNGDTTITASGSITSSLGSTEASVLSDNLTLSANGGAINLGAALTTGGVLNVTGDSNGVTLRLNSGALIGQVSAGTAQGGYGDVVISATGDLEAASGSGNVTGNNITLTSSAGGVGTQSAPLRISTNGTKLANGGILGGTLTVSALHDIGLEQDSGDLSVNSVTSTAGNVFINVAHGGIYDVRGSTPASVLSDAQVQQVWDNLHLLDPSYATRANPSGGNLSGSVSESGTINLVSLGGSLTPTSSVSAVNTANPPLGTINTLMICQDLAGAVTMSGTIHHLNIVNGSIKPTASLTLGNLDSLVIGPNHLSVGQNFAGTLTVIGNLGSVQVAGGIPGWIRAGHIGTIAAYGGYGPVLLRVTENGVERRVEEAVPGTPYPLPNPASVATAPYVKVQYIYEGTLPGPSGTLANPQLTARITNNVGTGRDQYDLSLVTYNDAAKFNLARLDAAGVAGVRNVDVEGDVLKTVSSQASGFFPGDTTPAGIRLPLDNLAGVGVRDFVPNASIQAASTQELAFGSHATGTGQIVTGAASTGSDAQALLVSGTAMVYANDTYRAPFADLAAQQVQEFFVTNSSGGSFNSNGIRLTVQSVTSPNAAGTANVVTLVPTYNSKGQLQSPVVQSIALRGDGGSFSTQQPFSATASITSTGPLGDLAISSAQGINNVTAPSIFASLTTPGPITCLVQTTGQRTDPITSVVTAVSADLGRLYVNTSGSVPVVTSTTVTANGFSGELGRHALQRRPEERTDCGQGGHRRQLDHQRRPGRVLVGRLPRRDRRRDLGNAVHLRRHERGRPGRRGNDQLRQGLARRQCLQQRDRRQRRGHRRHLHQQRAAPGLRPHRGRAGSGGLNLMLADLAALYVNSQGNLAGPKP